MWLKIKNKMILAVFIILLTLQCWSPVAFMTSAEPSRVINVVYDDSGSMIETGGVLVDTWCQAKYAMEVFAALLGENDVLNVYAMSDFVSGTSAGAHLTLYGSDGQSTNVEKIHSMITSASSTPFDSVRKAYSDLESVTADEKWLVVLTDGEFEGISDIDAYFETKAADVDVMFLSMGANASAITEDESNGIYYEQASTSEEILTKLTSISSRIFAYDQLAVSVSTKTLTFDIPMSELTIFAQGANVSIDCIIGEDGKEYQASSNPVVVQYSDVAATNYSDYIVDENLKGTILTFKDDFDAGTYTIEVSGADTIEVYYKPNVEISAYLTNISGEVLDDLSSLETGEYILTFGFVKAGTTQVVENSALLGDIAYQGWVTNNGVLHDTVYTSGDLIYIEEGTLEIDASALYLSYYTVETHIESSVFENKNITFSIEDNPTYEITAAGMQIEYPIVVKAMVDGQEVSATAWEEMDLISLSLPDGAAQLNYGDFKIEKSDTPGVYYIEPSLFSPLLNTSIYENVDFVVTYDALQGDATWSGEAVGTLNVMDTRTWLERMMALVIKVVAISLIGLFFCGYLPFFKKYLPKKLKKRPSIDCSPNTPAGRAMMAKGRFNKSFVSTIVPYRAEVGTLKFVPPGVSGVAVMQVKAAGGNGMYIKNTAAYAGKSQVTFNGSSIMEGTKKMQRIGATSVICYQTKEMSYTCVPTSK